MKSNNDDAAVVILVFQVTQWKMGCWLDLDFLIPYYLNIVEPKIKECLIFIP